MDSGGTPVPVGTRRVGPRGGLSAELPEQLRGHRGDYLAVQSARVAEQLAAPGPRRPVSTAAARECARAKLAALLEQRRRGAMSVAAGPDREGSGPHSTREPAPGMAGALSAP